MIRITRWQALAIWLLGTLTAIALIGDAPYLGLLVAILSGIAFGLANVRVFEDQAMQQDRTAQGADEAKSLK